MEHLSDDQRWCDTDSFRFLVQAVSSLCKREQRRGGTTEFEEEVTEIREVLEEAAKKSESTPTSVLKVFRDEFGV